MRRKFIQQVTHDIGWYKEIRDAYKKQYLLQSKSMDHKQRRAIKKQFMKVDRLRNHLTLWMKHLNSNMPSKNNDYIELIERGRKEIQIGFKQLNQSLYRSA